MRTRSMFFDAPAVLKAVGRTKRKALAKFGAFVRQRAKSSMRRRKGASPPGRPPSRHKGLLARLLFFKYDPAADSVVIGPEPLAQTGIAPPLLEYGGTDRMQLRDGTRKTVRVEARPYMGPAFEKEKTNLPRMWADAAK